MKDLIIIKIIKKPEEKEFDDYNIGEIIEVVPSLGHRLIKKEYAKEANKKEMENYQINRLMENAEKKMGENEIERKKRLKIDNYTQNVEDFYETQPFFYDKAGIFWFWNIIENRYEQKDDIDVMTMFDNLIGFEGQTVTGSIKNNYLEAFKRVGRFKIPMDAPTKWIQFKDKAYSLNSGKIYEVRPNYFFCNPIPWEIGVSGETPTMDKLFVDWVGKEYVDTLYEVIAYCCFREYPIQLLFCLYGSGRNGKSCFMRLLTRFLGHRNICSTELDTLLDSRFESFKLYKKLLCSMGETNFGILSKTSLLKKLVGGDTIGYEKKNKDPFDEFNYAKILISSNSLPTSQDTSDGFYRRWMIIDFPNQFQEGKDILKDIPDKEYNNLCKKVIDLLPKLLERGQFINQGDPQQRKWKYMAASNPLPIFLDICCDRLEDEFISYNELYVAYITYLKAHKKRKVKTKEFKSALEDEGFWVEKTSKKEGYEFRNGYWIDGLCLKSDWKDKIYDNYDNYANISTQLSIHENEVEKYAQLSQKSQKTEEIRIEDEEVE